MNKIIAWLVLAILMAGFFALMVAISGIWMTLGIIGATIVITALILWAIWTLTTDKPQDS